VFLFVLFGLQTSEAFTFILALCESSSFHGGEIEDDSLLEYSAM
jgi:hypothetical protein